MENDDGGRVSANIVGGTQAAVLVRLLGQLRVEQHILGAVLAHRHVVAAVHRCQIYRSRPVAGGIHRAALAREPAYRALQVDVVCAHLCLLDTAGRSGSRSQVSTRRKTAGGNKRGIELIFLGLAAHETNHGTYVVDLCRPLGIHARTVVGTNHCIAGIEQGLHDGAQVGHTLTVVAEPRTAVDVNHHGIAVLHLLGQVDVAGVISLVIAGIVHILPFLRGF